MFQDHPYTVSEYEAIATQYPDKRLELIDGEIVEKVPTQLHAAIVSLLNFFIVSFLREKAIGHALIEARYSLPGDDENDRIPDLSFISHEKGPLVKTGAAPYMPDLAIEVQSPGQSDRLMAEKAAYYLAHRSHMVWLVYPDRRLVEILTPEDRQLLTDNATIDGGDILPGFSVAVKDIFPDEDSAS
ncbi:MAG: Uma2 family endonuclease [Chloroflexi bacterium]|nr:Uma2 family endonuclease [Chloroflexota bacterium]